MNKISNKTNTRKINDKSNDKSKKQEVVSDELFRTKSFEDFRQLLRTIYSERQLNPLLGDIYAFCYYAKKPLSFKELSRLTGYSISSLSLALKMKLPLFEIVKVPGDKQKYVSVKREPLLLVRGRLTDDFEASFADFIENLNQVIAEEKNESLKHDLVNFKNQYDVLYKFIADCISRLNSKFNEIKKGRYHE